MNITFRVDASLKMGTGHVMRCLALADALLAEGHHCHFITREHPGNLNGLIQQKGYTLSTLPSHDAREVDDDEALPPHAGWLGSTWQDDSAQTRHQLVGRQVDWLIVDHYAVDRRWEQELRRHCRRLMVIDDLADREHECHLLLDQSLGRQAQDYVPLLPVRSDLLLGPRFALLRDEFAQLRQRSLARRQNPALGKLLVNMGGVDASNVTSAVLNVLRDMTPSHWRIKVVMGATAPWRDQVIALTRNMPCPTEVIVNATNMAELMCEADLAIGAAGSTSWERCCLGLPSIMLILADNQRGVANQLQANGAAALIESVDLISTNLPAELELFHAPRYLKQMSSAAQNLTDGRGVERVVNILKQ
jgi:UDP-2,4-diacetamido-2,4,6-trideoxy-beta-L-altropyranose hydrolase